MGLIDLSATVPAEGTALREVPLKSAKTRYTGMVYDKNLNSMHGSYIDFPGHIRETADGRTAENVSPEDFYRIPCSVIHLDRSSGSGAVSGAELETAFGGIPDTPALMINALGTREEYEMAPRSVYLDSCAVDWIIRSGAKVLVSDIYESQALEGVFLSLFGAGISTVCIPRNMSRIHEKQVLLTVAFLKIPEWTQVPCRILAETEENESGL